MTNRNDVDSMADLIRALGDPGSALGGDSYIPNPAMPSHFKPGDIDPVSGLPIEGQTFAYDDVSPAIAETVPAHKAPRVAISSEENTAMANILKAFHESGGDRLAKLDAGIEETSTLLFEDSEAMPELRRAMQTEKTNAGVRIGGWEIVSEGKSEASQRYHVISAESSQAIAKNLYLYEAAQALVNLLNGGAMINNLKVQGILQLEMEYAKHIEDAIQYKHTCSRAIDRGDDNRLAVAKSRFNESKTKAVAAKQKLIEHLNQR